MNKSKLEKQTKSAIEGLDDMLRSIGVSQSMYRASATIYPPRLDQMISEFRRDAKCCMRRWELLSSRFDTAAEDLSEQIIDDFRDIRQLYIQVIKKLDDILFEFRGIDDVDRALSNNSDSLDAFGYDDDNEGVDEGDLYYDD